MARIAMVARWKPVHLGQAAVLRGLCDAAEQAVVGIGSSNRYDLRNPFTAEETRRMIGLVLADRSNWRTVEVPDLDDGPRWRAMVVELFGPLDCFVTDNPYVASLMGDDYHVMRPVALVRREDRVAMDGTMVRRAMARGDDWQEMVPPEVAGYLVDECLDKRFRREFGLETLAAEADERRDHVLVG